jgi:hypothetical protein
LKTDEAFLPGYTPPGEVFAIRGEEIVETLSPARAQVFGATGDLIRRQGFRHPT